MRPRYWVLCAVVVLLAAECVLAAEVAERLDIRRAVPPGAYLAIYGKHNPERDYQRAYYEDVWKTVKETRIFEKLLKIVSDRMPAEDLEKANTVLEEIRQAASPIDLEALLDASEVVYAQMMQPPATHHLLVLRLGPKAAGWEEGIKNLFGLAEKYSEGAIRVKTARQGDVEITTLALPPQVPLRPAVARVGDILFLSSSEQFARQGMRLMVSGKGECKFDDPRLKEALGRLPEPEDALVFYDGKEHMRQLRGLGDFIRMVSRGDRDADRVAEVLELIFDEVSIMDYAVTVEYTEGNLNRTAEYGKLLPGAEEKVLMKALGSGEEFKNWQTWIPADALSYSLNTGVNLHPVYEWVMQAVKERFPEADEALAKFEQVQAQYDVYLDRDILQAFSGEFVSVGLPAASASARGGSESVLALRCHKPQRIRELMHRAVDFIKKNPFAKTQQLDLVECKELEGFEQLSAGMLNAFGARPVIGFRDGWMFVGSGAAAVEKVLAARAGEGKTIADTEAFERFDLKVEGPVAAISYSNLAEGTRNAAKMLSQAGAVMPMIVGMLGAQADAEELKPVQELLGLLPDVAKIVAKFDFLEEKISVTQDGDEPGSYIRRTATLVRPQTESPSEE